MVEVGRAHMNDQLTWTLSWKCKDCGLEQVQTFDAPTVETEMRTDTARWGKPGEGIMNEVLKLHAQMSPGCKGKRFEIFQYDQHE